MIGNGGRIADLTKQNPTGSLFISDDFRFVIDEDLGLPAIKCLDQIWKPSSFVTGPDSLWIGRNVAGAAAGHHFLTENAGGVYHYHAHSDFDGEISQSDVKTPFSYYFSQYQISQPDFSNEWIGTEFTWTELSTTQGLLKKGYWKTGSIAATETIRIQVWRGEDENGFLEFDQSYEAPKFPANEEIFTLEHGFIELIIGQTYFTKISSAAQFSLLTNTEETKPWNAIDISLLRYDNLLQTSEWSDGGTYAEDQWFIDGRKIYICNVTGVQTGTFADNSDKWNVLSSESHTHDSETDPIFALWDKSTGILIDQSQISDLSTSLWIQDDATSWKTWTPQSINPGTEKRWRHCDMSNDGEYQVAVGNEGQQVWVSNDYGQTWAAYGETMNYMGVACSSDGKYMTALVINGIIRISSDYGQTWAQSSSSSQSWCDVAMDSTGQFQIASEGGDASNGDLWLSNDYGDTWTAQGLEDQAGEYGYWNDVAMSSDGQYIMATDSAEKKIMRSKDYGATWAYCGPGTGKLWQGVDMSSDGQYVIISSGLDTGNVRISTDYGDSWKTATGCPSAYWHGVAVSSSGKYMVVGCESGSPFEIYMSNDYGENFSAVSGTSGQWADFAMSQDGALRLGASDSDDLFTAQADAVIHGDATIYGDLTSKNSPNWDEAYGWGDHSQAGYLTAEDDPAFLGWDKSSGISINESQISDLQSYLTSESDPVFSAWDKSSGISVTESQISDLQTYLLSESDPVFSASSSAGISSQDITNWDGAYSHISNDGSDHSFIDQDLKVAASPTFAGLHINGTLFVDANAGGELQINRGSNNNIKSFLDSTYTDLRFAGSKDFNRIGTFINKPFQIVSNSINRMTVAADGKITIPGDLDVDNITAQKIYLTDSGSDYIDWTSGDGWFRFSAGIEAPIITTSGDLNGNNLTVATADVTDYLETPIIRNTDGDTVTIQDNLDVTGLIKSPIGLDVPEIFNSVGILKIMPDAQYDTEFFGDTDVANNENSKILKVWRRSSGGNDYIRFYISANRTAYIHASNVLTLQAQNPFVINSVTEDITFKVGDSAGAKKFYFKDSDGNSISTIDSNGNAWFNGDIALDGSVDGVNLADFATSLSDVDNTSDADKPINTDTQTALDGKIEGVGILRKIQIQVANGATPGTNIDITKTTTQGRALNAPIITDANDLAKSSSSGSYSLSSNGENLTLDFTETATHVLSVGVISDDLNNGGGGGYYVHTLIIDGNIQLMVEKSGNTTNLDWTAVTNTGSDFIIFDVTFLTSD